jgi:aspartyl-tRNA(Asn)/glutamyl-tRNA(Gln) amidotransferase subunit C
LKDQAPWNPNHGVFVYTRDGRALNMKLTIEEVRHVAELAKLKLSDAEVDSFADQLSAILDYAQQVQEVDTSAVPPTPYVLPLVNVMDADEPRPSFDNAVALANAPDQENGHFRVKAIFEE